MLPLLTEYERKMFEFLAAPYPLQEGLIKELSDLSHFRELRAKEILLKPGEVCKNLYFIHQGLLRCYYVLPPRKKGGEEREVSTFFLRENDFCVSVISFYTQTAGKEFIQAEEPTKVSFISHDNLEKAYLKFMNFNYNGRLFTVKYLIELAGQLENIRRLNGAARFAELLKRDPELLRRVPQKYLASYLGVTPTSLSRMLSNEKKRKK